MSLKRRSHRSSNGSIRRESESIFSVSISKISSSIKHGSISVVDVVEVLEIDFELEATKPGSLMEEIELERETGLLVVVGISQLLEVFNLLLVFFWLVRFIS